MNRKLAKKMAVVQRQFSQALQQIPVAASRDQIKPARFEGHRGVEVQGRFVWGVSSREYWKFCKAKAEA